MFYVDKGLFFGVDLLQLKIYFLFLNVSNSAQFNQIVVYQKYQSWKFYIHSYRPD